MTRSLLVRLYLAEYSRRPINLALLVVVPVIFVALAAGTIADFAAIVGGVGEVDQLAAPTAGWAAAFLAGVAGFFHVLGSRDADTRLAEAGMGTRRVMVARLASGLVLALVAASAAIGALALRTGLGDTPRTVLATTMEAVIYLGLGSAVGALFRNEVNGSLMVIFIWMVDVFLGPAMAGGDVWVTRFFPSHYVTLVALDSASGHAGPIGDVGWALLWTIGSVGLAVGVFGAGRGETEGGFKPGTAISRVGGAFRYGFRDYRRNVAMWVLLVLLPIFFISLSFYITPQDPVPVELLDGGVAIVQILSMADVHGAIMVPITIAFLAGLAGLFVVQGSREADARLTLAGFRPAEILLARLGIIGLAAALTTATAVGVTAFDFTPQSWAWFTAGNLLVAVTYGMVGVLIGALFGRLGGLYVMFLLPFVDIGLAQNVMFSAAPPAWGASLPGRGGTRVLVDAAFTPGFDQAGSLLLSLGWILALTIAAAIVFHRVGQPRRT